VEGELSSPRPEPMGARGNGTARVVGTPAVAPVPRRPTATGKYRPLSRSFYRLGIDNGLETVVAFPTPPNVMDLPVIPIFGPFGGNQLLTALDAG
jgi:hypothetical protein